MNRFVVAEPSRCIGCGTCLVACFAAHKAEGLQSHPRLAMTATTEGSAPIVCRHCEDAMCAQVCPVHAISRKDDAIVLDEKLCIGCKLCALACPFGAITPSGTSVAGVAGIQAAAPNHSKAMSPVLVWEPGVKSVAVKCDLCAFRDDGPSCVAVCPTAALVVVEPDALRRANALKQAKAAAQLSAMPALPSEDLK